MNVWQKTISALKALSMNCQEACRAQSESLDHALPPSRRTGLRIHLFLCKWCRRYGQQIRFLHQAAGSHSDKLSDAKPGALTAEARARIKQRLKDVN